LGAAGAHDLIEIGLNGQAEHHRALVAGRTRPSRDDRFDVSIRHDLDLAERPITHHSAQYLEHLGHTDIVAGQTHRPVIAEGPSVDFMQAEKTSHRRTIAKHRHPRLHAYRQPVGLAGRRFAKHRRWRSSMRPHSGDRGER
jgi:hypothetical protein